tara:strand:+ start:285 stop:632 length:348 start_codon:yes stop_codon:yes gene_type:complete
MAGRTYSNQRAKVAAGLKKKASPLTIMPPGTSATQRAGGSLPLAMALGHYTKGNTRLSDYGKEKRAAVADRIKEKASPGRPTGKNSKLVAGVKSRAQGRAASGGKMKATPTRKKK